MLFSALTTYFQCFQFSKTGGTGGPDLQVATWCKLCAVKRVCILACAHKCTQVQCSVHICNVQCAMCHTSVQLLSEGSVVAAGVQTLQGAAKCSQEGGIGSQAAAGPDGHD